MQQGIWKKKITDPLATQSYTGEIEEQQMEISIIKLHNKTETIEYPTNQIHYDQGTDPPLFEDIVTVFMWDNKIAAVVKDEVQCDITVNCTFSVTQGLVYATDENTGSQVEVQRGFFKYWDTKQAIADDFYHLIEFLKLPGQVRTINGSPVEIWVERPNFESVAYIRRIATTSDIEDLVGKHRINLLEMYVRTENTSIRWQVTKLRQNYASYRLIADTSTALYTAIAVAWIEHCARIGPHIIYNFIQKLRNQDEYIFLHLPDERRNQSCIVLEACYQKLRQNANNKNEAIQKSCLNNRDAIQILTLLIKNLAQNQLGASWATEDIQSLAEGQQYEALQHAISADSVTLFPIVLTCLAKVIDVHITICDTNLNNFSCPNIQNSTYISSYRDAPTISILRKGNQYAVLYPYEFNLADRYDTKSYKFQSVEPSEAQNLSQDRYPFCGTQQRYSQENFHEINQLQSEIAQCTSTAIDGAISSLILSGIDVNPAVYTLISNVQTAQKHLVSLAQHVTGVDLSILTHSDPRLQICDSCEGKKICRLECGHGFWATCFWGFVGGYVTSPKAQKQVPNCPSWSVHISSADIDKVIPLQIQFEQEIEAERRINQSLWDFCSDIYPMQEEIIIVQHDSCMYKICKNCAANHLRINQTCPFCFQSSAQMPEYTAVFSEVKYCDGCREAKNLIADFTCVKCPNGHAVCRSCLLTQQQPCIVCEAPFSGDDLAIFSQQGVLQCAKGHPMNSPTTNVCSSGHMFCSTCYVDILKTSVRENPTNPRWCGIQGCPGLFETAQFVEKLTMLGLVNQLKQMKAAVTPKIWPFTGQQYMGEICPNCRVNH